jgi:hypothetical protein
MNATKARLHERVKGIIIELQKKMGGFPGFARISLHPAAFGEVIPVGFVPREGVELLSVDVDGTTKKILGVEDFDLSKVSSGH